MFVLRLFYLPLSIIAGFISRRIGHAAFQNVWRRIDDAPPPKPGTGEGSMVKVVGAQAMQASVMVGTAAVVDRLFARFFYHLIGIWPKKPPDPDDA